MAPALASPSLGLASPPLASPSLVMAHRRGMAAPFFSRRSSIKNPAFLAGFFRICRRRSDRTAGATAPGKSQRAGAGNHHHGPLFDHDGAGYHDHLTAVRAALAIGVTMPAGAAAARGACAAKTRNRACQQGRREKILHVVSFPNAAKAALDEVDWRIERYDCHSFGRLTSMDMTLWV